MTKKGKFILVFIINLLAHSHVIGADRVQGLLVPKKDTVYFSLLEGLKLLAVGNVDEWINGYCDGIRLCNNSDNINMIRQYRAKIQEKVAPSCIRNGGEALEIDYVIGNPEIDIAVKIYLVCDVKGPPRFYSLRKTAGHWFFISL